MRRVLAADFAKLVHFDPTCRGLLVLGRRVVTVLAIAALQSNDFSHDPISHSPTLAESALIPERPIHAMRKLGQTTSSGGGYRRSCRLPRTLA